MNKKTYRAQWSDEDTLKLRDMARRNATMREVFETFSKRPERGVLAKLTRHGFKRKNGVLYE